jgi:hypothetical protein
MREVRLGMPVRNWFEAILWVYPSDLPGFYHRGSEKFSTQISACPKCRVLTQAFGSQIQPPSTTKLWLVMLELSSAARKRTRRATSSGWMIRFSACLLRISAL